ncbi:GNAT family N-acetyltransferase [Kocuria marina]|uniref:GNAT family N-acetyltransferase n=1 Tax=Kocuria marina TaxID=223184 RepID=UPI0011A1BB7A|nr:MULTISPECIES: GNAT family protein [Kocuria]MCT2021248.1 GNAT family N-acetyltransferase [Kocuria marina]
MTSAGADIGPDATGSSDTVTAPPTLRPLHADDAAAVLSAFRSDPAMSRQGTVTTSEEAEEYVHRLTDPGGSKIAWAVCHEDGLVGLVCLAVDEENRNGWFSYWMTQETRGRGWTTRAAATVADWALDHAGFERLELGHRVNNPASGAVARAAGFRKEGTERGKFLIAGERVDVDTYGRLRTDPRPGGPRLTMSPAASRAKAPTRA